MTDAWLARIAANYTSILGLPVTVLDRDDPSQAGYDGFRVKIAGGYSADVLAMLVNWRLALVPQNEIMPIAKRYWCFGGRDAASLALALGQAALWDGSLDWQPAAFTRAWNREQE